MLLLFLLLLAPVLTEVDFVAVCGVFKSDVGMNQKQTTTTPTLSIDFNTIVIKTLKNAFVLRRFFMQLFLYARAAPSQNNSVIVIDIDVSMCR